MTLQFLDVHYTYDILREPIDRAMRDVMESGQYIGGPAVDTFEDSFAKYCGTAHCVGTGNGLDALVLALRALDIGPGDEVIVPAHTFIATWLAVSQVGARLVPVDTDARTMNLDIALVEQALTPQTKAVIAVHLYGNPVDLGRLAEIAERNSVELLVDAAQAHGAQLKGQPICAQARLSTFSFYPGKNLGAFGDAGAVATSDPDLAGTIRRLANYGMREKYQHIERGVNSRIDPLQAAILQQKLSRLDAWNAHRAAIAAIYLERLASLEGLTMPKVTDGATSVWHLFVVRHPKRDDLAARLKEQGIPTALHYPIANHLNGAYRDDFEPDEFPVTRAICETCLSLPIGPHLSLSQAHQIAETVSQVYNDI
ncbi:MAG: DegT/DnrJ/EryC1/StrS family aminotransferase [Pseudomonadota bacterium]